MKVQNMTSSRGKKIANQFIITTDDGEFFQSYDSIICFKPNDGKVQLDPQYWDYSKTTSKYRNLFLGCDSETVRNRLADGEYEFKELN